MKRTAKYDLAYFQQGDTTNPIYEMQRWETVDAQLQALFAIMGNGVISGWNLISNSNLSVVVTPGEGHVSFVAVESTDNVTISNLVPNTRNYIYAQLTNDSYWTKNVAFSAFVQENPEGLNLLIGYADTDSDSVTNVSISDRTELGFRALVQNIISEHRHIGGTNNPEPIDLSSEVQGVINQRNLPNLDASILQSGTIDPDRLPKINHIDKLSDKGCLSHAQIDSFIDSLNISKNTQTSMGEIAGINLLQLLLALKHIYPTIDDYLVNVIAFIPGISPDDWIDTVNTTATVDTRTAAEGGQHTITGTDSTNTQTLTKIWDSKDDFENADKTNIFVDGSNFLLSTEVQTLIIDDFDISQGWTVSTDDRSAITAELTLDSSTFVNEANSGKFTINDQEIEVALLFKKSFNAQNWSNYKYLIFYIYTNSAQHGDIFFYFNDANAGVQNSHKKVLSRNTRTINEDTLQNGWQEIVIDISNFSRTAINSLVFYVTTQNGWDTSKGFNFNIDNIHVSSGNQYKSTGYLRTTFNNDLEVDFWRVRWDAILPSDSLSSGVNIKSRVRTSNTEVGLSTAEWSSYTSISGTDLSLDETYKWIEIEILLEGSTSLLRSPIVNKIYLDYNTTASTNNFLYNSRTDWESGINFNLDTSTNPGSISILNRSELGSIPYGSEGEIVQVNSSLNETYRISGSTLPISTYQALNGISPQFGTISGIDKGNNGNFWVVDTENDRIVELDNAGNVVKGYMGSWIQSYYDPYGEEESGPGSNVGGNELDSVITTSSSTIKVLHSFYNNIDGVLYVIFDSDIENIYASDNNFDINKIFLKIGTQRVYLNDSDVELGYIDREGYDNWGALYESDNRNEGEFIKQFKFTSHVLKFTLNGPEKSFLNDMVDQEQPSLIIASPYANQKVGQSFTVRFTTLNVVLGTDSGQYRIKVTFNGNTSTIQTKSITYNSISNGYYDLEAVLVDSDNNEVTNIEGSASCKVIVSNVNITSPHVWISEPRPNQIYSTSPVTIKFGTDNFPVLSSGQHLQYSLDGAAGVDIYNTNDFILSNLNAGLHTLRLYVVDEEGSELYYTYHSSTVNFVIGLNNSAVVKLHVNSEAIFDYNKEKPARNQIIDVAVSNFHIKNIYGPLDVQVVPFETSSINDGQMSLLIAKMRSPSSTSGLSGDVYVTEFNNRLANTVEAGSADVNANLSEIETKSLIYGTKYLDGHSIVQLDINGDVILSNNAAVFSDTKDNIQNYLGSGEKLGTNEILVADGYKRRAMIIDIDMETQVPKIIWQYDSSRYISDFHLVPKQDIIIEVDSASVTPSVVYIRPGTTITWKNVGVSPISIYSGSTTYENFYLDPSLNRYGDDFFSSTLNSGESYTYTFQSFGEFDWFVYPTILRGSIHVTENRISPDDEYILLETDGLTTPFSSRVIKINSWGHIVWSFGESFLVNPRDARPLYNGNILIST